MQYCQHGFGLTVLGRSPREPEGIASRYIQRVCNVFGTVFFLSYSSVFYFLVTFVAYMMWYVHYAAIASGLIIIIATVLFLSVFVHEFAHALMTRALGGSCESVLIDGFGGVAECSHFSSLPRSLSVILVGPLTHLLWVAVAIITMLVGGKWDDLAPTVNLRHPDFEPFGWQVAYAVYVWQLVCFVLNFLPILPASDGSHAVQVLMTRYHFRARKAFYISWSINLILFIGFGVVFAYFRGPLQCLVLLLVACFVLWKREWELMLDSEREILSDEPDSIPPRNEP